MKKLAVTILILLATTSCSSDGSVSLKSESVCKEEKSLVDVFLRGLESIKIAQSISFNDARQVARWMDISEDNAACNGEFKVVHDAAKNLLRERKSEFLPVLQHMCSHYPRETDDVGLEMRAAETRKLGTRALAFLSESTASCNNPPPIWMMEGD